MTGNQIKGKGFRGALRYNLEKVDKEVAEEFKEVCKEVGVAMGTQLTRMMKEFIEEVKK